MAERRYAQNTKVEPEASVAEIRKYVSLRGASGFTHVMGEEGGAIRFQLEDRWVQFHAEQPSDRDEQEWRRRWRVILLKVKTAFEVWQEGANDTTVDEAFLPYILLPDGRTFGQHAAASLPSIYAGEQTPGDLDFLRPALGSGS